VYGGSTESIEVEGRLQQTAFTAIFSELRLARYAGSLMLYYYSV
jgi:hypothetical protein